MASTGEGMDAGALLDAFVQTFVEGRYEDGERLWAPNGIGEEIGTGRTFTVKEGTENARAWKAAFPDAQGQITNRVVCGNRAVGEVVWTGTNTGSLNGMAPTGKPATMRAVVVLEEEGGKIARLRHYLDIASMMAQLGAMPAGAQAQGATSTS